MIWWNAGPAAAGTHDPEVLQVVELRDDALDVTDAVTVRVAEGQRVAARCVRPDAWGGLSARAVAIE